MMISTQNPIIPAQKTATDFHVSHLLPARGSTSTSDPNIWKFEKRLLMLIVNATEILMHTHHRAIQQMQMITLSARNCQRVTHERPLFNTTRVGI